MPSIPKSIYWAVVTLTTVGYGDLSPQTSPGQFLAAIVMLMLLSILASFSSPASASDIVITDPIEVVQSGVHNDRMMAMDADSEGNVHVVWSRNTNHLYYKMW